jgi:hypothetical protein
MFGPKRDEVQTGGHYTVKNSVIYKGHLVGMWVGGWVGGWLVGGHSVSKFVNSVGKGPFRVDIYSGGQGIPFFSWKSNVHDPVHRLPHVVPILNQLNPGHTLTSYF